jgi:hypothetical protein
MPAQSSRNPVKRTDQTTRAFPWWRVTALAFAATAFAATQVAFSAMVDAQPQAIGNVASTTRHHVTGLKDTLVYQYPNSPYFQDDGMIQINVDPGGDSVDWLVEKGCRETGEVVRDRSGKTINVPPISGSTEGGADGGYDDPIVYVRVNADDCPKPAFVGMAPTPAGKGYWLVENNGVVENFGDAKFEGDAEQLNPNKRAGGRNSTKLGESVVAIAAAARPNGYWIDTSTGIDYAFGNAKNYGSMPRGTSTGVVGLTTSSNGKGYYQLYQNGYVHSFGDVKLYGEVANGGIYGGLVAMSVDERTGGYWLASANGDVLRFNAPDDGSLEGKKLSKPIVGIEAAPDGSGYRLVSSTGRVFCFKEKCEGDLVGRRLAGPVVGIVADGVNGYWILDAAGQVFPFGGARGYGNGKAPY